MSSLRNAAHRVGRAAGSVEEGLEAASAIAVELRRGVRTIVQAVAAMKDVSARVDALKESLDTRLAQMEAKLAETKKEEKSG